MTGHCSLFVELIVFKPNPNGPGYTNSQIHPKAISPYLNDATNMTISRKKCLDVPSNAVIL
jgi:hypothetical protein